MADDMLAPDDSADFLMWFDGTVDESYWSTPDEESTNGKSFDGSDKVRLYWHITIDEVHQDYDGKVPESLTLNFTTGTGWEIQEDDDVVRHEDDDPDKEDDPSHKPKRFKASSMMGQILGLVTGNQDKYKARGGFKVFDGGDDDVDFDMESAREYLVANGFTDSRVASIWKGTRWTFRGLGLVYNPDEETRPRALPVAYLGVDGETSESAGTGQTKGSAEAPAGPSAADIQSTSPVSLTEEEAGDVARLLAVSSTHTSFMRNALSLDWVKANDEVKAWVTDAETGAWTLR